MTEPEVASSDATNVRTRIERVGEFYVINGRKWWISGVGDPRCRLLIVMGKTDRRRRRTSSNRRSWSRRRARRPNRADPSRHGI